MQMGLVSVAKTAADAPPMDRQLSAPGELALSRGNAQLHSCRSRLEEGRKRIRPSVTTAPLPKFVDHMAAPGGHPENFAETSSDAAEAPFC
jgi:hypothetical protein